MLVLPPGTEVQKRSVQIVHRQGGRVKPGLSILTVIALLLFVPAVHAQDTPSRTPDGQPALEGMYTRGGVRGLEAEPPASPIDPAEKNPLSVSNRGDGLGPYPRIFGQGGQVLRAGQQSLQPQRDRRSGIVDPPDRKLPWRPEEEAKRRQFLADTNPARDLNHVEFNARCLLPGLFAGEDGNNPYTF